MNMRSNYLSLFLLLLTCTAVRAHDYWLQPAAFFPDAGKPVAVSLHVGDHFTSENERSFEKKTTLRFQHISADRTIDLAARAAEGVKPIATITPKKPGIHMIALERDSRLITLEAKKFNHYLAEEGLDAVLTERRKRGEDDKPGRERYWRSLKARPARTARVTTPGRKRSATSWRSSLCPTRPL